MTAGIYELADPATTAVARGGNQQQVLDVLDPAERDVLIDLLVRVIEANGDLARPGAGRRKRSVNGQTT